MAAILFSRKHLSMSGDVLGCHDLGSGGRGQGVAKHLTAQDRPTTKDRLAPKASSAEAKKPGQSPFLLDGALVSRARHAGGARIFSDE